MKRLRLKIDSRDPAHVIAQGSTRRSYRPFAQAFGTKRISETNAALIVKSVNCHNHLVDAMQRILRTAQRPANGNTRLRLVLIARYAAAALRQLQS